MEEYSYFQFHYIEGSRAKKGWAWAWGWGWARAWGWG